MVTRHDGRLCRRQIGLDSYPIEMNQYEMSIAVGTVFGIKEVKGKMSNFCG